MKIRIFPFDLQMAHDWAISGSAAKKTKTVNFVELTDVNGIVGIGESSTSTRYDETPDSAAAFLRKVDARRLSFDDIPGSMAALAEISTGDFAAKCAVNLALVDGAAQQAGKSVYDWLGLGFTENKHVTSYTIGIDSPDMIKTKVREAEQYPVLKLKVGGAEDRAVMQALREVAPRKRVRLDANEGWKTKEIALENIEWFAKDKYIEFVEQPMPADTSPKDLVWLKARSPLELYADESYISAADATFCAECYHGVNVKLIKTGGITGGHEALLAAKKAGLKRMIGCMLESSVLISAGACLAELADHLDIDTNLLITNDPYLGPTAPNGIISFASAPETTGLRVTPNPSVWQKKY